MAADPSNKAPRVSILMCSKNADWIIHQTLAGIFSQSFTDFELILLDLGSSDHTMDIASQYACRLIELDEDDWNSSVLVKKIVQKIRGELVVLWNADAVALYNGTLENLVAAFEDPEIIAAYSCQIPRPDTNRSSCQQNNFSLCEAEGKSKDLPYPLPVVAVRKTIWEKRPLFTNGCIPQDPDWGEWLKKNNYKIKYVPSALVMYSPSYTTS